MHLRDTQRNTVVSIQCEQSKNSETHSGCSHTIVSSHALIQSTDPSSVPQAPLLGAFMAAWQLAVLRASATAGPLFVSPLTEQESRLARQSLHGRKAAHRSCAKLQETGSGPVQNLTTWSKNHPGGYSGPVFAHWAAAKAPSPFRSVAQHCEHSAEEEHCSFQKLHG